LTHSKEYPHERLATSIHVDYFGDYKFITYDGGHRGQPYRTRDGEWAGPILVSSDMASDMASYMATAGSNLEAILRQRDAPEMHPHRPQATTIVALTKKWRSLAEKRVEDMHRMEREPEYQRLLRNDRSRLPLTTQFVKQFCASIDNTKEWKSLATSHSYVTRKLSDTEETLPLVKFRSMFVQDGLEDILGLSNPLDNDTENFDWVKECFDSIYDDGYHRIETLLPENHAFDRAVIEHCRQNYPNGAHILNFDCFPVSEDE
jgi:hypothetical protein